MCSAIPTAVSVNKYLTTQFLSSYIRHENDENCYPN